MNAEVIDLAAARRGRLAQLEARHQILQAANRGRMWNARYLRLQVGHAYGVQYAPAMLTMRHLDVAVCICRQSGLVDNDTLALAGFKPRRRRVSRADRQRDRAVTRLRAVA